MMPSLDASSRPTMPKSHGSNNDLNEVTPQILTDLIATRPFLTEVEYQAALEALFVSVRLDRALNHREPFSFEAALSDQLFHAIMNEQCVVLQDDLIFDQKVSPPAFLSTFEDESGYDSSFSCSTCGYHHVGSIHAVPDLMTCAPKRPRSPAFDTSLSDEDVYREISELFQSNYSEDLASSKRLRTFRAVPSRSPTPVLGSSVFTPTSKPRVTLIPKDVIDIINVICDTHSEHNFLIGTVSTIATTVILYQETSTFRGRFFVVLNFIQRITFNVEREVFITLLQNILLCDPKIVERQEREDDRVRSRGLPEFVPTSKKDSTDVLLNLLEGVADGVDDFTNSPMVKSLGKLFACAAAHELLGGVLPAKLIWAGFMSSSDVFSWSERKDIPQMMSELLRSISVVIRSLLQRRSGNCEITINNEFEWIECVRWLKTNEYVRTAPDIEDPPVGYVSDAIWRQNLLHADMKAMMLLKSATPSMRPTMGRLNTELVEMLLKAKCADYASRPLPFNVAIVSAPGTGKSTYIAHSIIQSALSGLGVTKTPQTLDEISKKTSTINLADKFLSNYSAHKHLAVIFDEMGASNPVTNPANEIMGNMTSFLGESDFYPTRAAVGEKGKELFRPHVNVCISNAKSFGIGDYIQHIDAFYRRIAICVEVRIKPEYVRKHDGTAQSGIDFAKLAGKDRTSAVEFQLLKDSPNGFVEFKPAENEGWMSYYKLNDFITACAKQHCSRTSALADTRAYVDERNMARCEHGFFECPTCSPLDSEENAKMFHDNGFTRSLPPTGIVPTSLVFPTVVASCVSFACVAYYCQDLRHFFVQLFKYCVKYVLSAAIEDYKPQLEETLVELSILKRDLRFLTNRALDVHERADQIVSRYYEMKNKLLDLKSHGLFRPFLAACALGAGYAMFSKFSASKSDISPASHPVELDGTPVQPNDVKGSSWDRNDGFVQFGAAGSAPPDVLDSRVKRNIVEVEFVLDGMTERTHLTGIRGNYAVGVWHSLRKFADPSCTCHVLRSATNGGTTKVVRLHGMKGSPKLVYRISDDLAVIRLVDIPSFRDISKFVAAKAQYTGSAAAMSGKNIFYGQGPPFAITEQSVSVSYSTRVHYSSADINYNPPSLVGDCAVTFEGHCGSPFIAEIGSQRVLNAIVCAAEFTKKQCVFHCFDMEMFNKGFGVLNQSGSYSAASSVGFTGSIHSEIFEGAIERPSRNNHAFYMVPEESGSLNLVGSFTKALTRKGKSKVVDFPFKDELFKLFPVDYHHQLIAPVFSHVFIDGVYTSPERNALMDMSRQVTGLDIGHVDDAIADYSAKLASATDFQLDHIMSSYDAINGSSVSSLAASIPKSTSSGFPFLGKKFEHLVSSPSDTAPHGHEFTPAMQANLDLMLARGARGKRNGVVFKTATKDEPRDAAKVADRKIRLFTLGPVDFLVYCKKFFGIFMSVYNKNFLISETVGGINPFSPDWGRVFEKLSKFPNIVNGDFSKFDKKSSTHMIMAAATVVIRVKEASLEKRGLSMSESYRNSLISIASDIANPLILMDRDMLDIPGSLSSGVLMTFLFNDIINSLYIRMAYYDIYTRVFPGKFDHVASFEENVCFFSLGDDNTYSVSNEAIVYFNFASIQAYFAKIGIKYTNADKTDNDYGCLPLAAATIGKRKWAFNEEHDMWMCPIEKQSILKMMTIGVRSKAISLDDQQLQSVESAIPELAQHGREEFDLRVADLKLVIPEFVFPSFDEIITRQRDAGITPWIPMEREMITLNFEL